MKRILLPIDSNAKTFETVIELASKFEAEVLLFAVEPPFLQKEEGPEGLKEYEHYNFPEKFHDVISNCEKEFEGTGIKVTSLMDKGDEATRIIEIAKEKDCDLIVMSSHGESLFRRFVMGSVAHKVALHATVSVLIVR